MMKLMGDDIIMMIAIFRCDGRAHQKSWSHVRLYVLLSLRSILFSDTCCWNHLINDSWETSAANGSCRNKDINSAIVNRYHFAFWELSDICDFRLNERTTHKKLYAHISRMFYCNCWYHANETLSLTFFTHKIGKKQIMSNYPASVAKIGNHTTSLQS